MFGDWEIEGTFASAHPFPHVILHNFFTEDVFQQLHREFGSPETEKEWIRYWNPLEKKYALNFFSEKPFVSSVFEYLQTNIDKIKTLTGLDDLIPDGILVVEDIPKLEWTETLKKLAPDTMECEVHDRRSLKGRFDDILLVGKQKNQV